MRKKGEAVYDAKYAGKKGSRKDIYEAGSEEEEEGSEGSEDEELDGFEDLEGGSEEDEGMEDDSGEEEEGEDEEEEDEEKEAPVKEKKEKKSSSGKSRTTTTDQDEKAMLKQLKQAASADVDKGRDVKKQLVRRAFVRLLQFAADFTPQALCDNLLEARIKIQKATTSANALPQVRFALPSLCSSRTDLSTHRPPVPPPTSPFSPRSSLRRSQKSKRSTRNSSPSVACVLHPLAPTHAH